MTIALGVLASLLIGSSDYFGAHASGRSTALQSTTAAFLGGAIVATIYSPLLGSPSSRDVWLGALSGVVLALALTLVWRGYAVSSLGIVAPVAAVVATALPVLYDVARGESPSWIGWLGVAVGIAALFLTSWAPGGDVSPEVVRTGVVLGAASGVLFAAMFVISVSTSEDAGTWPVVPQRLTAFALAASACLVTRQRPLAGGSATWWSLLAGVLGASGVAAITYGGQRGSLTQVVVAGSMYPAVAIGLAWLLLRQRLATRQVIGLVAALVGVALISLG